MKNTFVLGRKLAIALVVTLFFGTISFFVLLPRADAQQIVWQGDVDSTEGEAVAVVLHTGIQYQIEASGAWRYNVPENLAADAQYYTTDFSNSIYWGNNFLAPDGHSFLQIDSMDVDWGPFSNGETGHTYTIFYAGSGEVVTFRIVDWIDQNQSNNECHIHVVIYRSITVGGTIEDVPLQAESFFVTIAIGAFLAASVGSIMKLHKSRLT